ncbi:YfbM family protein [Emticicia agri]|uniref:DUF1877 family protein n=1 Tax=Emticicia agri TaxID=2492393 RepID=A0A4Q5LWG3_9BACT|nr:YfbM family protein [Emticicia agri]RYU93833.1 DUF1877 family protein [Emticicia agri]
MSMIGILLRVTAIELEAFRTDSSLLIEKLNNEEEPNLIDIDKAWAGIIFLIDKQTIYDGPDSILFGRRVIDRKQDLGYGPAYYFIPDQVKESNERILRISEEELRNNYDAKAMMEAEVYPEIWEDEEAGFNYLLSFFKKVQSFYAKASSNNEAIITFLN